MSDDDPSYGEYEEAYGLQNEQDDRKATSMELKEFAQICIQRAIDAEAKGERDEAIRLLELLVREIEKQIGVLLS